MTEVLFTGDDATGAVECKALYGQGDDGWAHAVNMLKKMWTTENPSEREGWAVRLLSHSGTDRCLHDGDGGNLALEAAGFACVADNGQGFDDE